MVNKPNILDLSIFKNLLNKQDVDSDNSLDLSEVTTIDSSSYYDSSSEYETETATETETQTETETESQAETEIETDTESIDSFSTTNITYYINSDSESESESESV